MCCNNRSGSRPTRLTAMKDNKSQTKNKQWEKVIRAVGKLLTSIQ